MPEIDYTPIEEDVPDEAIHCPTGYEIGRLPERQLIAIGFNLDKERILFAFQAAVAESLANELLRVVAKMQGQIS